MYYHIIGIDDELWDTIEECVTFEVDEEGIVPDTKCLTHVQRKIYKKYHRVRGMLLDVLPHAKYTKVVKTKYFPCTR